MSLRSQPFDVSMRCLWLPFCLVIAVLCNAKIDDSKSSQRLFVERFSVTELLRQVKDLRKDQEDLEFRVMNVSAMVKEKFLNLNRQLDAMSGTVDEYHQNLNTISEPWRKIYCPKKKKTLAQDENPVCSFHSCFKKLLLKESSVNSIKRLRRITGVTSLGGCGFLCQQEVKCVALRYNGTQRVCTLLTKDHRHVEPTGRIVELWVKPNSKFRVCPKKFSIRWQTSRYVFFASWSPWIYAYTMCRNMGGKLAELTSKAEIDRLAKERLATSLKEWHVGGEKNKSKKSPWYWYRSKILIPTEGFRWASKPTKFYRSSHLTAHIKGGELYFSPTRVHDWVQGFLCECIELPQ